MTWFILSRPADPGTDDPTPISAAPETAAKPPPMLPPLVMEPEAVPSGPMTLETVRKRGVVGQGERWLRERMAEDPNMKPVEGTPNAWKNERVELRWRTDAAGQVFGAEAVFFEASHSADLTVLSPYFVGNQDALPVHFEVMTAEEAEETEEGTFESRTGVTYHYRAAYRTSGEPPYGPARFEIQTRPFE